MGDQILKAADAPDGSLPQYIKVPRKGWIAKAGDCIVSSRPEHAKAFMPAEALEVCRKLLEIGYEGASATSELPDVPDWAKEPDRKDGERRYSIASVSTESREPLTWQGDCWSARTPRSLFTHAEAASELARLCELRPYVKTMHVVDDVEGNECANVWARAFERVMEKNGYRALNDDERRTIEGKRLRYAGLIIAQAAVHEAGFLGYEWQGWPGWPEAGQMSALTQSATSDEPESGEPASALREAQR